MTRAMSSLPVPLSPVISTVAALPVTLPISFTNCCMDALVPTMSPRRTTAFSRWTSSARRDSWRYSSARSTTRSRAAGSGKGLWM
ncbi:hypothetical protein COSO111634_38460 [Corallococcus soli]